MDRNALWKWLILAVMIIASITLVVPLDKKIKKGIDIAGGTHFVVAIDEEAVVEEFHRRSGKETSAKELGDEVKKALRDAQPRALEVIRNRIDALGTQEPIIYAEKGNNRIVIQLPGANVKDRQEAEEAIQKVAFLSFHIVHRKNADLVAKLMSEKIAIEGYKIVELDGKSYYKRDRTETDAKLYQADPRKRFPAGKAPVGYMFLLERVHLENRSEEFFFPCCVKQRNEFTGEFLSDARVEISPTAGNYVSLEFDSKGAKKFAQVTMDYGPRGANNLDSDVGYQLAIVLDYTIFSAPEIKEAIHGGKAQITGRFPGTEAYKLALVLRSGSMPAPVKIIERRIVDPSLGKDSIESGVRSVWIGSIAVLVFMVIYYGVNGVIADIALILNIVLLPLGVLVTAGFMSLGMGELGSKGISLPVLTLPGIAGIGLTIGMAVDANILICERMREEYKTGKRFWSVVLAGYDRAFSAIVDSNLTTVLTGVILFIFGTGPVRGFAITLNAGILISLFTAIVVTKLFYGLVALNPNTKQLRMMSMIKVPSIDWISKGKIAITISVVIFLVSWAVMIVRGIRDPSQIFAVDFVSGTSVTCSFAQKPPVDKVREALDGAGIRGLQIQYQSELEAGGKEYLSVKANFGKDIGQRVRETLTSKFPKAKFFVTQQDDVNPQVGAEMTKKAVIALGVALIGIIIYMWVRFELGFGIGAVVAVFHDVLITAGLYSLFGFQMSLTVVAALLTIIGYSVNDTIVIFDRVRENLKLIRDKSFVEICNISVNQTFSRTMLTNFATFMSVVALMVFGGGSMKELSVPLFIGMIAGTYSTVYIATPVMLAFYRGKRPELGSKVTQ